MERPNLSAYDLAENEIPQTWYEKINNNNAAFLACVLGMSIAFNNLIGDHSISIPIRTSLGLLYISSRIVDRTSTTRFIQSISLARQEGLSIYHREQQPIVRDVIESGRNPMTNPKLLAIEVAIFTFLQFVPGVEATGAFVNSITAFQNTRVAKRYERAVEIAQTQK